MKLENHIRGLSVLKKLNIINCSIEETIHEYEASGYQKNILKKKYQEIIKMYDLNENTTKEDLKKKILEYYGNEIPGNVQIIYVVAYCGNKFKDDSISIKNKVKKVFANQGFSMYYINKIVTYGLKDAIYLGLLDDKGNILDKFFFENWCLSRIWEKDFVNVLSEFQDSIFYENRYLIFNKIQNNKINFNDNIIKMYLKKDNTRRLIYNVSKESEAYIALKYLKKRLDTIKNIKYPDRNVVTRKVFSILANIKQLSDYTIFKFDFKDYFNSISTEVILKKYISNSNIYRYEYDNFSRLCESYKRCYAGLPVSNAMVEIISNDFDTRLKVLLNDKGLIHYSRYVDDVLIIFNRKVNINYIKTIIEKLVQEIFEKSDVKINENKTVWLYKNSQGSFNYLGYCFKQNNDGEFQFGISHNKISKHTKKLESIFDTYHLNNNEELLRQRLLWFISRVVFYEPHDQFKDGWDAIGIIDTYQLLRNHLENLEPRTKQFLNKIIIDTAQQHFRGDIPYFLRGSGKQYYSLFYGLKYNKTILFHPSIGWNLEHLKKMINKIDNTINLDYKSYIELCKIYCSLIKI